MTALAQAPGAAPAPVVMPTPAAPPSHLAAGDQYFEADLSGLRAYLESISVQDPSTYAAMEPKVSSLESKQTLATVSMVGGLGLGLGLLAFALATQEDCGDDVLSDAYDRCTEDNGKRFTTFTGLGLLAFGVGGITWLVLKPGRSDLLEVVNEHNRIRPQRPLRLNLGWDRKRNISHASLAWEF